MNWTLTYEDLLKLAIDAVDVKEELWLDVARVRKAALSQTKSSNTELSNFSSCFTILGLVELSIHTFQHTTTPTCYGISHLRLSRI